ncbi:hypothetical protein BT63DRAFT_414848 [Microthyrium microscopicum]|uniref:Calcium-channel protein CCH1 n=1 Tax=Microthyrium microscopicum TaxID=703497 RepID=A0A6A6U4Q3_9PEZI|nr:hypothetical protein BT63DRAFT_414848 [Microthyrium microscopicum]
MDPPNNDPSRRRLTTSNATPIRASASASTSNDPPISPSDDPNQSGRLRSFTDTLRGRSPSGAQWVAGGNYQPLSGADREYSPTRPPQGSIHLAIPASNPSAHGTASTPTSPLDIAGFQAALTGIPDFGVSLSAVSSASSNGASAVAGPSSSRHVRNTSNQSSINTMGEGASMDGEGDAAFSAIPLIENVPIAQHPAPISGSAIPHGQRHNRNSRPGVRFGPQLTTSHLGDDLGRSEGASLSPTTPNRTPSQRSVSPTSPLTRTRTMIRQMSQRIVNLSNEQDVVERSIRRKSSVKDMPPQEGIEMSHVGPVPQPSSPAVAPITPQQEKLPSIQINEDQLPPRPGLVRGRPNANPFRGKSLGLIPEDSTLRMKLCDLLLHPWTEPAVFCLIVLQTILLAIDSNRHVEYDHPALFRFGNSWIDYCILALFAIYTIEIIIRIIVSGFILNPVEYSTINREIGWGKALKRKSRHLFGTPHTRPQREELSVDNEEFGPVQPSLIRALTMQADFAHGDSKFTQRVRLARRAFLRHSFNRLDFIAVCAYWISFGLQMISFESGRHIFVFRMLSCLRIMRLLYLTSGTTVILRSLKKAAPMLLNVAFLIGFFWLLFAIVGVQSFQSSLRRQCVWTDPTNSSNNWTNSFQFCGGHLNNATFAAEPWIKADGTPGTSEHKGYLCPPQSNCVENGNPYNGSVSFDNIANSAELIFVIMTSNTFTDLMYYLTNSDYLAAAVFFAVAIVILFLWLINLLIAVITSSFQVIREESKASAFTGEDEDQKMADAKEEAIIKTPPRSSTLKKAFEKTKWFWLAVIAVGLLMQCFTSASMSQSRATLISVTETIITFVLLIEMILRVAIDWRTFFKSKTNLVDFTLAVITTVIQIPQIHNSGSPYAWLTFFQIARIYRLVLAIPLTRDLILIMLGNVAGLANLILFVFLFTFLAAILAAQMFRGSVPQQDFQSNTIRTQFQSLWNSFLGMYQIFSSENWTAILYSVTSYDIKYNTAWMAAAFFILWYILANFITLNMFIAVIQENFDVSEDEKRLQQVKSFLEQREAGITAGHGNLSLSTIFRYGLVSGKRHDAHAFGNSQQTELLLKDAVVRDFLDTSEEPAGIQSPGFEMEEPRMNIRPAPTAVVRTGTLSSLWTSFVGKIKNEDPNPFYSRIDFAKAAENELDPSQMAKEVMSAQNRRKQAQREYLRKHPNYNVSLFMFRSDNPIRKICQRIVGPGRGGARIDGVLPTISVWYAFSAFIYAAIVAMVVLACVTTPLYQKEYFQRHNFSPKNWFVFSDLGFAVVFSIEAAIKIIADGFFWTPNAYFRSTWGFIDGVVLITLWINVSSQFYNAGQVSRAVGAFKALRALRLLNVSDSARENFHSVIVRGGVKVISAAFVSLSLLFPFAILGLNIFSNKFVQCNDGNSNIFDLNDCVGEYNSSSPYNWNVYAPRVAANSYYSFDNFGDSLFILFQIVSQEGWIDVMWSAQSVTGIFKQPAPFSAQGNAVFFVIFNLLGAVFVLTLFVSVFMRNYTEMTGVAFLTSDQRSWLELRKLLRQVSPSKRPVNPDAQAKWMKTVYRLAVRKTGAWQRFVTCTLVAHLILLCLEFYPTIEAWERVRDALFLLFTLVVAANIVIRIMGLTWPRFSKSSWDIYSIIAVAGTLVTTVGVLISPDSSSLVRVNSLFLVSLALLIIPRNNQLDQLFKTAAASLTSIINLLATWFVLFLVFAIALTQAFGLTRFGPNENGNINFRNVPKALILLFRTSVGEGWNQIMEDMANIRPPYCVDGVSFNTDCGSPTWARIIFILWNILSMYIFVNLFVSLIYESFSYVYQKSSGLSVISREEIRRFKDAWAVVDPNGTGYIEKDKLPHLLRELSGVFEMRIYDGDFTVKRLMDDCAKSNRPTSYHTITHESPTDREIDLAKLNERLRALPILEIRRRRHRLNQFYEEVLVSSERDRGISFSQLLMILAHYKVINDNKSLRLHEFLRRRARLQRVDEAVRRQIVIGFFDTLYWRRFLRKHQAQQNLGRMQTIPTFTVPEIFVEGDPDADDEPHYPAHLSTGPSSRASSPSLSGIVTPPARNSIQVSPGTSPPFLTPQISPMHLAVDGGVSSGANQGLGGTGSYVIPPLDLTATSLAAAGQTTLSPTREMDGSARSRSNSAVSVQSVLDALDESAWGESLRRSISRRRPGRSPSPEGRV